MYMLASNSYVSSWIRFGSWSFVLGIIPCTNYSNLEVKHDKWWPGDKREWRSLVKWRILILVPTSACGNPCSNRQQPVHAFIPLMHDCELISKSGDPKWARKYGDSLWAGWPMGLSILRTPIQWLMSENWGPLTRYTRWICLHQDTQANINRAIIFLFFFAKLTFILQIVHWLLVKTSKEWSLSALMPLPDQFVTLLVSSTRNCHAY